MLIGNLDYLALLPYLPPSLQQAIDYVKSNIDTQTPTGIYPINEDKIFVIVAENQTEPAQLRQSEYHQRYIDVQILLSGEENFMVSTQLGGELTQPYEDAKDIAFLSLPTDEEKLIHLKARDFIIFYPPQRHKPLCCGKTPQQVKKAIIKFDKTLL